MLVMHTGWRIGSALLFYSAASVLVSDIDVYSVPVCYAQILFVKSYANMILRLVHSAPNNYTFPSRSRIKDKHANYSNQYAYST
ncbi:hypothetical protein BKA59DRAFT_308708 [Fusarium tricinctum]|jgi:hypothetical protein|uniref:Secreted protein n=1 Tax=Fusarium tricinctum TaxID=61284 RepID=A0A8K0RRF7_9HYPO|nr:hypothetical protein BKA59DRAFT_308708 [Fusarium tricinctum]